MWSFLSASICLSRWSNESFYFSEASNTGHVTDSDSESTQKSTYSKGTKQAPVHDRAAPPAYSANRAKLQTIHTILKEQEETQQIDPPYIGGTAG